MVLSRITPARREMIRTEIVLPSQPRTFFGKKLKSFIV